MRTILLFCLGCGAVDPDQIYRRGMLKYELGRYREAIEDFTRAWEASGEPALLYDLAQAYRKSHDPDKALPLYRAYLQRAPLAHNRVEVKRRIAELKRVR